MTHRMWLGLALAAGCALSLSAAAIAQDAKKPRFAAPQRVEIDGKFLGAGRLYPSPVFLDVDGDGHLDIVVGDLPGRVTFARRVPGGDGVRFAPEKPITTADGKPLKFHNW